MQNRLLKSLKASLILTLTTSCAALNLENPAASDSFCSTYQQLIRAKGEGSITALRPVKNRIAANEKTYICLCSNPTHAVCRNK